MTTPTPVVVPARHSDQFYTALIHAGLVAIVVLATVVLAALKDVDQATTAAILGTSLGYTGGTSAARRVRDNRANGRE